MSRDRFDMIMVASLVVTLIITAIILSGAATGDDEYSAATAESGQVPAIFRLRDQKAIQFFRCHQLAERIQSSCHFLVHPSYLVQYCRRRFRAQTRFSFPN